MKNSQPRISHAVVGYCQPVYLKNCINSVLRLRLPGEQLEVIVTGGLKKDFDELYNFYFGSNLYEQNFNLRFHVPNSQSRTYRKTGSLYDAYNLIFDECFQNNTTYLNLIQSDFQLMFWNTQILSHYLDIFNHFPKTLQINTGFVRRGSHPDFYQSSRIKFGILKGESKIPLIMSYGISDWGFYNVNRCKEIDLHWNENETNMGQSTSKKGFFIPMSLFPSQAPVPWPQVIRKGKKLGKNTRLKKICYSSLKKNFLKLSIMIILSGGKKIIFQHTDFTH